MNVIREDDEEEGESEDESGDDISSQSLPAEGRRRLAGESRRRGRKEWFGVSVWPSFDPEKSGHTPTTCSGEHAACTRR